jgi:hypothetical protein
VSFHFEAHSGSTYTLSTFMSSIMHVLVLSQCGGSVNSPISSFKVRDITKHC